ncbi:MAG: hypothetical protein PWQ55_2086 [Chloroflexota bacterium]|nr:hypothetical protein [Chloroflexota bacterium]
MGNPKRTRLLTGLILALTFILSACGGSSDTTTEENLQETLQAIYQASTLEAIQAQQDAMESEQPTVEPPAEAQTAEEDAAMPEAATEEIATPGDPPKELDRTLEDSIAGYTAEDKKATQGDNILDNLYERPFTSQEMVYQADLDITTVDFGPSDDGFYYFTIRLYGMNSEGGGLKGLYGIEFDRTLTGRGDLLVTVKDPQKEWSMEGVTIYLDDNRDVGGLKPIEAESGFNGSGYDSTLEMDAEKNAFARIDPKDGNAVQFAISFPVVGAVDQFLWGAWADNGLMDPTRFDYNDSMGPTEAGSPIRGNYYPVKGLYNLDNTCRLPFGLEQTGLIAGMCKIGVQKEECKCLEYYTVVFGSTSYRVCIKKECK